jgi:hypothetical protein
MLAKAVETIVCSSAAKATAIPSAKKMTLRRAGDKRGGAEREMTSARSRSMAPFFSDASAFSAEVAASSKGKLCGASLAVESTDDMVVGYQEKAEAGLGPDSVRQRAKMSSSVAARSAAHYDAISGNSAGAVQALGKTLRATAVQKAQTIR